jgi:hypothetical protein
MVPSGQCVFCRFETLQLTPSAYTRMKVFISWSGTRSGAVAQQLSSWLKLVIQSLEPWLSANNIDKGTQWDIELSNELSSSPVGIICLTRENLHAPWILFEAGALHKGASTNRVCTFLLDVKPSDVEQPLAKFNHTSATASDVRKLMGTLNSLTQKPLPEAILTEAFDAYWPKLAKEIDAIKAQGETLLKPVRKPEEILNEVLEVVRSIHNYVRRPSSAHEALAALRSQPEEMVSERYEKILRQVLGKEALAGDGRYDLGLLEVVQRAEEREARRAAIEKAIDAEVEIGRRAAAAEQGKTG